MPQISDRVQAFTDSVIRRMTRISDEYGVHRDSRILIRRKSFWIGWLRSLMKGLTSIR